MTFPIFHESATIAIFTRLFVAIFRGFRTSFFGDGNALVVMLFSSWKLPFDILDFFWFSSVFGSFGFLGVIQLFSGITLRRRHSLFWMLWWT